MIHIGFHSARKPGFNLGNINKLTVISSDVQYVYYSYGSDIVRKGIRDGNFVIDITLTATGFSGTENTDWTNLYSSVINPTTTTAGETVTDIDGNVYTTVVIGTQTWMVENLKTTKYKDGTAIPNLTDGGGWAADTTGAYCWYDNDIDNKTDYGALYNWYAVDNAHGLAPEGWHIPTKDEMDTLITYLGGNSVAGGKLKYTGTTFWNSPNTGATNESGFSWVGGGLRSHSDGSFSSIKDESFIWTSTEYDANNGYEKQASAASAGISESDYNFKKCGFSVRCIKDS